MYLWTIRVQGINDAHEEHFLLSTQEYRTDPCRGSVREWPTGLLVIRNAHLAHLAHIFRQSIAHHPTSSLPANKFIQNFRIKIVDKNDNCKYSICDYCPDESFNVWPLHVLQVFHVPWVIGVSKNCTPYVSPSCREIRLEHWSALVSGNLHIDKIWADWEGAFLSTVGIQTRPVLHSVF